MTDEYVVIHERRQVFIGSKKNSRKFVSENSLVKYLILPLSQAKRRYANSIVPKSVKRMTSWHWERIPVSEYSIIREAIETHDYAKLLHFHNHYNLSDFNFCCGDAVTVTLFNAFKFRNNQGLFDDKSELQQRSRVAEQDDSGAGEVSGH